jgi:1-acyl-sn-glycerol-3-phosphate acyltransferase
MPDRRYRAAQWVTRAISPPLRGAARALFDLEITGSEHVPKQGGLVVAPNHLSHLDPGLVTVSVERDIRYIALDELFGSRVVFDAITLFFGAIPTDRDGAPLGALREAVHHLRAGGAVGVFPEGRRVAYWGETTPKRGAAWLAWMAGAPLLPVTVHGTERTLSPASGEAVHRPSVRIWIDEPLQWHEFSSFTDPLGAMTERWRAQVGEHLDAWWQRYARSDDTR